MQDLPFLRRRDIQFERQDAAHARAALVALYPPDHRVGQRRREMDRLQRLDERREGEALQPRIGPAALALDGAPGDAVAGAREGRGAPVGAALAEFARRRDVGRWVQEQRRNVAME